MIHPLRELPSFARKNLIKPQQVTERMNFSSWVSRLHQEILLQLPTITQLDGPRKKEIATLITNDHRIPMAEVIKQLDQFRSKWWGYLKDISFYNVLILSLLKELGLNETNIRSNPRKILEDQIKGNLPNFFSSGDSEYLIYRKNIYSWFSPSDSLCKAFFSISDDEINEHIKSIFPPKDIPLVNLAHEQTVINSLTMIQMAKAFKGAFLFDSSFERMFAEYLSLKKSFLGHLTLLKFIPTHYLIKGYNLDLENPQNQPYTQAILLDPRFDVRSLTTFLKPGGNIEIYCDKNILNSPKLLQLRKELNTLKMIEIHIDSTDFLATNPKTFSKVILENTRLNETNYVKLINQTTCLIPEIPQNEWTSIGWANILKSSIRSLIDKTPSQPLGKLTIITQRKPERQDHRILKLICSHNNSNIQQIRLQTINNGNESLSYLQAFLCSDWADQIFQYYQLQFGNNKVIDLFKIFPVPLLPFKKPVCYNTLTESKKFFHDSWKLTEILKELLHYENGQTIHEIIVSIQTSIYLQSKKYLLLADNFEEQYPKSFMRPWSSSPTFIEDIIQCGEEVNVHVKKNNLNILNVEYKCPEDLLSSLSKKVSVYSKFQLMNTLVPTDLEHWKACKQEVEQSREFVYKNIHQLKETRDQIFTMIFEHYLSHTP